MDITPLERLKFNQVPAQQLTFCEFFAGGGMARIGLGPNWHCSFANEWCNKKALSYRAYFGASELKVEDVARLSAHDVPGTPALVWASFPCQDLSLAGPGAGLKGERSGTFKPFSNLIGEMISLDRVPKIVVLENVVGALTSHKGRDFTVIVDSLAQSGYQVGAIVIDAVRFLPQSRPRLFFIAIHSTAAAPMNLTDSVPDDVWHTRSVREAYGRLPERLKKVWIWWKLPVPNSPIRPLREIIEDEPTGVRWHTPEQTERLVSLMSPLHRKKLDKAKQLRKRIVGTIYMRTRLGADGARVQRAEVRFDQISGCLRTPVGGSSRQVIILVDRKEVRTRLLSPREAARLMGVPENYPLPSNYNDAYHLLGDGLAVPVVSWLEKHLLQPLASTCEAVMAA